jgi:hypothetical protein
MFRGFLPILRNFPFKAGKDSGLEGGFIAVQGILVLRFGWLNPLPLESKRAKAGSGSGPTVEVNNTTPSPPIWLLFPQSVSGVN